MVSRYLPLPWPSIKIVNTQYTVYTVSCYIDLKYLWYDIRPRKMCFRSGDRPCKILPTLKNFSCFSDFFPHFSNVFRRAKLFNIRFFHFSIPTSWACIHCVSVHRLYTILNIFLWLFMFLICNCDSSTLLAFDLINLTKETAILRLLVVYQYQKVNACAPH